MINKNIYSRHLSGEIAQEWDEIPFDEGKDKREQLTALVQQIIPFQMTHNAEAEACDLLMEIEQLEILEQVTYYLSIVKI